MSMRRPSVVQATPRLAAKAQAERSERRRSRLRRGGLVLAGLVPLALLGWVLLASPLLTVHTVKVSGAELLTPAQVRAAAAVRPGTPLARIDSGEVARRVRALRAVADVSIVRSWPRTLSVRITERTAVAAVLDKSGVTLVDASGMPFAPVPRIPAGTVRLQVPHPGVDDPTTRSALQVLSDLPAPLRTPLRIVRAASPSSVTLVLRDGRQILWGGVGDTALKAQAAAALLRMPGRVFDVSRPAVVTRR